MTDVKWIKIVVDVFDNRKIRQIEKMPEGDSVIVIWLKLLCLAGNINDKGMVYLTAEIPFTEEMLATEFNRPLTTIRMALELFQRFGMVEIIDNILKISSWEKYQNIEGLERVREQGRRRVSKFREKEKAPEIADSQHCNVTCNATVTQCNATDKNKNKSKSKNKNKDNSIKDTIRQTDVRRVVDAWNEIGVSEVKRMSASSTRYKMLNARIREYGIDAVLEAVDNVKSSSFLKGGGNKGWTIDFEWFVRPNNFPKVYEGKYADGRENNNTMEGWING